MRRLCVLVTVAACGGDDGGGPEPLFPADYTAYREVRDCRPSSDHDLQMIRVLVDSAAEGPYTTRTGAFPAGAVVLKEQFDFGDTTCSGPVAQWTVMVKADDGAGGDPLLLGWRWQRVDADRRVVSEDDSRCFGCHAECGVAPDGYGGTCAVP